MHRIRQTMRANRCPGLIVIDETEPLLRNEHFRNIFLVMLQEYRKLGGVVISVFQRPEALSAQNVSELIRQQCSTFYLYPNMGASERDYRELGLNEREISFILGDSQPARRVDRGLLVKRPQTRESVILDVDLKPLGRYLDIFSSRSADVDRVSDLQTQYPDSWLNHYIERDK
jgi:type IV secretory pathway VirB4 component